MQLASQHSPVCAWHRLAIRKVQQGARPEDAWSECLGDSIQHDALHAHGPWDVTKTILCHLTK